MFTPTTQDVERARQELRSLLHAQVVGVQDISPLAVTAKAEEVCCLARLCQAARNRRMGTQPVAADPR